ncbi:TetR/AcrR family transcriptional regulator [Antrihabitans stalactiti]|uniref:TetR/AcrR family transcriptional regulator n=1 Tax=Antrihabitans stalactiti TaxID=2584121 RepID=A0A848KI32_9NOCA|nr:TetR/AcrR family transcriptional regulator [Antrihabitans stalactiti]NMN95537.1 TetR/AcrR family transcriptional regulator [Antrihabitans stalactiti]
MPSQRKPLTRAESQQRTREEVLDAAEELFLAHGLHETTVAKIAAAAGRTQGAIYGNFTSKENVCAEVLLRRGLALVSEMWNTIAQSHGTLDDAIDTMVKSWRIAVQDDDLVALLVEYSLAVHKNPAQLDVSRGHIEMGLSLLGTMLTEALPVEVTAAEREEGAKGILSAALGLALAQTLDVVDMEDASRVLARTIRNWVADLSEQSSGRAAS